MSENNIVVVKDLEKKYKSGTHAVKGINFEVKKGEIFGMLGPNGACLLYTSPSPRDRG